MNSGEHGFTLLEAMVALAILAVGLAEFYRTFGAGLQAEAAVQREREAVGAADRLMAELGRLRPVRDGVTAGELPGGQRWTLRLEPIGNVDQDNPSRLASGHLATLTVGPAGRGSAWQVRTIVIAREPAASAP